jgi:site-specific recombinase XerD
VLQVHGKGARNRLVAVPSQALRALEDYLAARHLPALDQAPAEAPLLASATDPMEPISYEALYKTVRAWLTKALRASTLPDAERRDALRASPHWLRHTFGTRALEREIPLEVVQKQLGHADPRTTSRYTRAQLERQLEALEAAFGSE